MSRVDERSDPWAGRMAWPAKRITLLSWLLVLAFAVSAECAWVLWLQDVWTVTPTTARPHPRFRVAASEQIDHWAADPER